MEGVFFWKKKRKKMRAKEIVNWSLELEFRTT